MLEPGMILNGEDPRTQSNEYSGILQDPRLSLHCHIAKSVSVRFRHIFAAQHCADVDDSGDFASALPAGQFLICKTGQIGQ